MQFTGTPVSRWEVKSRFKGSAGPPSPPLALNSSPYWPKVSAPSGKLTSHWSASGHMTPPLSWAGNLGRQPQVGLKSEARAGSGNAPAGRRPADRLWDGG